MAVPTSTTPSQSTIQRLKPLSKRLMVISAGRDEKDEDFRSASAPDGSEPCSRANAPVTGQLDASSMADRLFVQTGEAAAPGQKGSSPEETGV